MILVTRLLCKGITQSILHLALSESAAPPKKNNTWFKSAFSPSIPAPIHQQDQLSYGWPSPPYTPHVNPHIFGDCQASRRPHVPHPESPERWERLAALPPQPAVASRGNAENRGDEIRAKPRNPLLLRHEISCLQSPG